MDTTSGTQYGIIETDCSGDSSNPDIFADSITVWCATGCAPLPEDFETYWDPEYNPQSANFDLTKAPIQPNKNYTVTVNCRDGYAPINGNGQTNIAYCSELGWFPALSNIQSCTSGCKDVRNNIAYGYSQDLRSTTLGGTPFNIGDVLTFACDSGYTMSGSSYLTCASIQTWLPRTYPKCVPQTAQDSGGVRVVGSWVIGVILVLGMV